MTPLGSQALLEFWQWWESGTACLSGQKVFYFSQLCVWQVGVIERGSCVIIKVALSPECCFLSKSLQCPECTAGGMHQKLSEAEINNFQSWNFTQFPSACAGHTLYLHGTTRKYF